MEWAQLNQRYVLPARKHLLNGRHAQGEELLRQGLEETGDGWLAFQLAEAIVWVSPDDAARLEEACGLYAMALKKLSGDLHRNIAEASLAKAQALKALAPKREGGPRTVLPTHDTSPIKRRPVAPPPRYEDEPPPPPDPLVEKLKTEFKLDAFRPGQREVIEALLKQKHAIAVFPPASGRDLLWELPSRMVEGATVIVGAACDAASVAALREGKSKVARIGTDDSVLDGVPVALLVIEDAHAVSDASHAWRPEYERLREVIQRRAPGTVLALTPLATPRVRLEIADKLGLVSPIVQAASFDRRNLAWSVIETQDRTSALKLVLAERGGSVLVVAQRRSDADAIATALRGVGVSAEPCHDGVEPDMRGAALEEWQADKVRVLVTVGLPPVEKRNLRAVVHWQEPPSLEQYYLEAATAGRDGEPAQCVLLHSPDDKASHATAIERAHPDRATVLSVYEAVTEKQPVDEALPQTRASLAVLEQQGFVARSAAGWEQVANPPNLKQLDTMEVERRRRQAEDRLRVMERYAEARGCRRMEMLAYFGERLPAGWQCAGCDRCRAAREGASPDAGVSRQAVVMGVRELEGRRFSINEMARAMLFLAPPHVTRPLKGKSEAEVRDLINALLREGAIELDARGQFVRSKR